MNTDDTKKFVHNMTFELTLARRGLMLAEADVLGLQTDKAREDLRRTRAEVKNFEKAVKAAKAAQRHFQAAKAVWK